MSFHQILRYYPKASYANTLFKIVGVDFIINNTDTYKIANDSIFDFVWHSSQDKLLLYIISCADSPWAVRQLAAAYLHAHRFAMNACFSCCDVAVSKVVNTAFPKAKIFSTEASIHRTIKRMVGTMRRNGGVYRELSEIISNFVRAARIDPSFDSYVKTISSYPCVDPPSGEGSSTHQDEKHSTYTVDNVKDQFEYESGIKFFSVFSAVDRYPIEVGDLIIHNASLTTGERVSITVMKRNIQRMRTFDLIPFQILNLLLKPIPFIGLEKGIYRSFIDRLTFSLNKEREAREQLLEKFGVDFTRSPSQIFRSARRVPLDLYIPAPLLHLCSTNVMVTDKAPKKFDKLSKTDAKHIVNFTSELLYNQGCIIPDLSKTNLRKWKGKISLSRFATLTRVDNDKFSALLALPYSMAMKNQRKGISAAEALGLPSEAVIKMITTREANLKVIRGALKENSTMLFPFSEASVGLVNTVLDSGSSYCAMEPFAVGALAKMQNKYKSHTSFPYNMLKWTQYLPL
ncbi:hypothetical protein TRFO_13877 [Tritrichomonas foetus]|uniref:ABC1 atypical kinase-like domain-containing protein n=1 Tax=Tritrichomonas foetus TaxID=1144522 RepID=A0A1J4KWP7_9EUKA|nr:hypothetical protein TRFO_13877 [Tritrichomonas foetus]|eukprot:OHT15713.1 hypothetical protein TRFO_13877 [Tritrichomonas foetus]